MDKTQELYNAEYVSHRENGDDPMNARLRLMEQGASLQMSIVAQLAAGETDDSEDGESLTDEDDE